MITGAFLDEITHDIPYQNWGPAEWARDFDSMKSVGIDTVIVIRAGYQDKATFDSKTLRKHHPHLIVQMDLIDLFLTLAEERRMGLYFGTYDSGKHWKSGEYQAEVDINREFADEVMERYGEREAFAGWYLSHEANTFEESLMRVYEKLAQHLVRLKRVPVMISPYIKGPKLFGGKAISLAQHTREWDRVFERIRGMVDIVAFQDGHVEFCDLPEYLRVNAELAKKHGLKCWSNIETFDRDMPIQFPPIGWPKLRFKIDAAVQAGVDKLITFDFSHFLSPNSCYPAAHHLFNRYVEHYHPKPARRR